ncbi:cytochrome-c peroxidase [Flavobacterium sp. RHBU_3]|uniref:cytochrome-c peroxidase n=1 Tax=Flavobacterium sp. RHBU_3 TaxID=3391184 RepID=UPI003984DEEF
MTLQKVKAFACLVAGITLFSCSTDDSENYQQLIKLPNGFPKFEDSETNPLTTSGIELGKKLFFDVRLSGKNTVSCATCHMPERAFSDGVALARHGVSGNQLHRNAPALINLAWATNGLFWDGGSANLESQAFAPLAHADEMYQNLDELVAELSADETYKVLFEKAFSSGITQVNIVKAIAQYERTLISGNSKYDQYLRGQAGVDLSPEEQYGKQLAEKFCFSCHSGALLTDNDYHNNGLDDDFTNQSYDRIYQGRYRVTYNLEDLGKYKTPTLRNIALTGPYMHDGRFETLEEVVNFYAESIKDSPTLDTLLKQNSTPGFALNENDRKALVRFLKLLTDDDFVSASQQ